MNADQLLKPWRFCQILARARSARVRGSWNGSAFRSHPCGLLVGNIKLANHWHVDDYCTITIGTIDKWKAGCDDSFSHGDPFPRPIDGKEIIVWANGRWQKDEFRASLESKVVSILNRALADVAAVESWNGAIEAHSRFCTAQKRAQETGAALSLALGEQP
jgi:hypothetical protein